MLSPLVHFLLALLRTFYRFVNTPDVVSAILRHPEAKVRSSLKIGKSVLACEQALTDFMHVYM